MDPPEDGKTLTAVFRPTHPVEWRSTEGEVAWISGLGWIVAKERQLCWAWGKAASTHWMWVARHPGDTQLSSQTQVYHIEHHVESAWAPYVYRHVLIISLFLSQNITFVKLQGVKIIRNNANFHTKKKTLLIKKDKQLLLLHLLRMAAAVISIWVQVYGERTFCFSGVSFEKYLFTPIHHMRRASLLCQVNCTLCFLSKDQMAWAPDEWADSVFATCRVVRTS